MQFYDAGLAIVKPKRHNTDSEQKGQKMNYLAASYEVSTDCNFYYQHNWHPKKQSTTEPQRTQRGSKTQVFVFTLVQKSFGLPLCSLCLCGAKL